MGVPPIHPSPEKDPTFQAKEPDQQFTAEEDVERDGDAVEPEPKK